MDEFIGGDGVALIEWPEMADIDPLPRLDVYIRRADGADENVRIIEIVNSGAASLDEEKLAQWRMKE